MDNFHILKVKWRIDEEKEEFKNLCLDQLSKLDQMSSDKLKVFMVRFWEFIQGNLSEGNDLIIIQHQCEYIEELIRIVPMELLEHKEEFRLAIDKIWNIFKITTTTNQMVAKGKGKGWVITQYAYDDSRKTLLEIVKRVSRIIVETLPLVEILDYDLSYKRSLLADDMDRDYKVKLEDLEVHEKFWREIKDILSGGNLCTIRDIINRIRTKQTLVAEEKQNTDLEDILSVVEDFF